MNRNEITEIIPQVVDIKEIDINPFGVDEHGGLFHLGKRGRIKHLVRFVVEVRVDGNEIGFGQQSIEIYALGAERSFSLFVLPRVVIENSHVPAAATSLGARRVPSVASETYPEGTSVSVAASNAKTARRLCAPS